MRKRLSKSVQTQGNLQTEITIKGKISRKLRHFKSYGVRGPARAETAGRSRFQEYGFLSKEMETTLALLTGTTTLSGEARDLCTLRRTCTPLMHPRDGFLLFAPKLFDRRAGPFGIGSLRREFQVGLKRIGRSLILPPPPVEPGKVVMRHPDVVAP